MVTGLLPGELFAGYRIVRRLGAGGMGTVYVGEHPRLPRLDAIKILDPALAADPEFRARFQREAELAARIDHPNVVAVRDRGVEGESVWISMQYVDGRDAAALLREHGPVRPERAVRIVAEAARGLDVVHRAGLLHRDVKPANILLAADTDGETVRITDFGIARPAESGTALTRTGTILASLAYAAPEQFEGGATDHRADVYSLGCTLFELLTGAVPFAGRSPAAMMAAHLGAAPPRPSAADPRLPAALDDVIARAMAKQPGDRYASCGELAEAAGRAVAEDLPAPAPPHGVPVAGRRVDATAAQGVSRTPDGNPGTARYLDTVASSAMAPATGEHPGIGGTARGLTGAAGSVPRVPAVAGGYGAHSEPRGSVPPGANAGVPQYRPAYQGNHSGHAPAESARRAGHSGRGPLIAVGAAVVVALSVVVTLLVLRNGANNTNHIAAPTTSVLPTSDEPTSAAPTTERPTTATTAPPRASAAWGPVAYIIDAFPDLLPLSPESTGYQGLRCDASQSDASRLHCPSDSGFSVNVFCDPNRTPQTYVDDPGLTDVHEERWTRDSGSGTVRWATDNTAGFGLLSVAFDDPARNFCVVTASGGSGGSDVQANWWAQAPI
ncbi:putative serine/threonine protein kinase [Nocardia nova SH22a]|uniref:non-specific serine/threonine protein kinase n=1 Tax=Nocardia nova SH22a TaxID=1415166 RepID=W5TRL7_9NOCA|nr:putative serine/threonine protein kinase [Nocardia nova SH22a]